MPKKDAVPSSSHSSKRSRLLTKSFSAIETATVPASEISRNQELPGQPLFVRLNNKFRSTSGLATGKF